MTAIAKPAHLHGLDGLRGVACLAVFVDHVEQYAEWLSWPHVYGPALQALGRQGVELFFVLSGYLITYRMLAEQRDRGRVSISAFYVRRALRIWPLYYLVVFVAFALVPWLMHHAAGTYVRDAWSWYLDGIPGDGRLLLYVFLLPHVAYFTAPPVLCAAHLWSIGVEEQFYLVWPWLMRLAGRRPLAMFAGVVLACFALNDLVTAYCSAIDERDLPRFLSLFTDDAVQRHRDGVMRLDGKPAIEAYYTQRFAAYGYTFHYPHAASVSFQSEHTATGLVTGHAEMGVEGELVLAAIRYTDRYRRTEACSAARR